MARNRKNLRPPSYESDAEKFYLRKKFEQLPGNNLEQLPGNNLPLVQGSETDSLQQLEQVVHVLGLLKDQPLLHLPSSIRIKICLKMDGLRQCYFELRVSFVSVGY
jgi:hypothetical protein